MKTRNAADDESIRNRWASRSRPPAVFIIGLHRSGTTFLYESMSRVLPVAKLTVRDVVDFDHLVQSHMIDEGRGDRSALARYFVERSASKRANDSLPLSPETAEEYGWILKRKHGSYETHERSVSTLEDALAKLAFMNPNARAILLKNPWDTGRAPYLAQRFPEAAFVFIRRDPIEILNSELGNILYFSRGSDALLSLLTRGVPRTRAFLACVRHFRTVVGTGLFTKAMLRLLTADVRGKLAAYDAALAAMPAGRAIEVSYDDLTSDPRATLQNVAGFLNLPVSENIGSIAAARRPGGLSAPIADNEAHLRARLSQHGLQADRMTP